jgi:hypothetical protein
VKEPDAARLSAGDAPLSHYRALALAEAGRGASLKQVAGTVFRKKVLKYGAARSDNAVN